MVRFLHFNDAYIPDLAPKWKTVAKSLGPGTITCGGDVYGPSLLSTVTKGKHVPELLRSLGVSFCCIGNHDLDFGLDTFRTLSEKCTTCPQWLCSNIWIGENLLPGSTDFVRFTPPNTDVVLGVIGIVGTDFVGLLNFDASQMRTEQPIECVERYIRLHQHECDGFVAITHMRQHEDDALCARFPQLLVLGGHDHESTLKRNCGKTSTDWQQVLVAEKVFHKDKKDIDETEWTMRLVNVTKDVVGDEETAAVVSRWETQMKEGQKKILANLAVPFDTRTRVIRKGESVVGNWLSDLVRWEFQTVLNDAPVDCVLINAGTIRGDRVFEGPTFSAGDLLTMLPFMDMMCAYRVSTEVLLQALQIGFKNYPNESGAFPCVCSGVRLEVSASSRKLVSVKIQGEELIGSDPNKMWTIVTKTYLAEGKDGYDCLKGIQPLMDAECALLLSSMVRYWLTKARTIKMFAPKEPVVTRFVQKLRKNKDTSLPRLNPALEGRIVYVE